ncbi:MAG: hypothetical protein KJT03_13065 [Verrucomicrobiae bacterium]|nr:hypothetical protein [Verrucomicrobiae bacterium]
MHQDSAVASKPGNRIWWCRAGLVLFILVLAIDTIPARLGIHKTLQSWVEPVLDKVGLWQGRWELFGPEPASTNNAVAADILMADGRLFHWTSPDPAKWTVWQKFRNFRWNEYYDTVQLDDYQEAWPYLADWIAGTFESTDNPVVRVRLYRRWTNLDEESLENPDPFPFSNGRMIFRKEFRVP